MGKINYTIIALLISTIIYLLIHIKYNSPVYQTANWVENNCIIIEAYDNLPEKRCFRNVCLDKFENGYVPASSFSCFKK